MSKVIRLTEGDLVRLVKKVIEEQTSNSKVFPEIPQMVPKENAEKTFFDKLGGVIKPMIGSKIQFFSHGKNIKQNVAENKKDTLVFNQFLPNKSYIDDRQASGDSIGPAYIYMAFQTDLYRPGSKTPIPCYTVVEVNAYNPTPGVISWGRPEVWISLAGSDDLSQNVYDKGNLFNAFATSGANDNLRMANLKIDSDAVMNLFKQYDATSLRKTPQ